MAECPRARDFFRSAKRGNGALSSGGGKARNNSGPLKGGGKGGDIQKVILDENKLFSSNMTF